MKQTSGKKPRGSVNYIWVLGGCYLLYTAVQLGRRLFSGQTDSPALNIGGLVVFGVAGTLMLWREWRAYRYGLAHKDDPETWSLDDDEEGNDESALPEEASADTEEEDKP